MPPVPSHSREARPRRRCAVRRGAGAARRTGVAVRHRTTIPRARLGWLGARGDATSALTIAGSDSGGGAGVQADLKTFAAMEVHGTCALTAVTAQNTTEVRAVAPVPPAMVRRQVETVLDDFDVRAVKTGMLATARIVVEVAALAASGRLPQLVVDPVLVSSSGHRLLEPDGVDAYLELLLPHAMVATPNLREAAVLTGTDVEALRALDARVTAAERIRKTGARYVVVKGGHLAESADDLVAGPEGVFVLSGARVVTPTTTAPAAPSRPPWPPSSPRGSPRGAGPGQGLRRTRPGRAARWHLGAGRGPLDHFGWSPRRRLGRA